MNTMEKEVKFCCSPHLIVKKIDDELAVLHTENGAYYTLNAMGRCILEFCSEPKSIEEILAMIRHECELAEEVIEPEIDHYLKNLLKESLVEIFQPIS